MTPQFGDFGGKRKLETEDMQNLSPAATTPEFVGVRLAPELRRDDAVLAHAREDTDFMSPELLSNPRMSRGERRAYLVLEC